MKGTIIIIILIFIISIIFILRLEKYNVKYIRSNIDNEEYLVRDLQDKQNASDLLSRMKRNILTFSDYLYKNRDEKYKEFRSYIEQLHTRIKNVIINESTPDSSYTSYSINKGEQIVFCLRSKFDNSIHNINLLMYVALHEMSHVASPTYGHDEQFKKVFAFFTKTAIELGLYTKIDFNNRPTEYCGLIISDSII
jgi:hypothetical protein